jgi:hypothetical protein
MPSKKHFVISSTQEKNIKKTVFSYLIINFFLIVPIVFLKKNLFKKIFT